MNQSNKKPPKAALRMFRWYCRGDRAEELEGDLEETYNRDIASGYSLFRANLRFWWNVIRCARPYAIQRKKNDLATSGNLLAVTFNNLKVILRNFQKNKFYGSLNILGLALSFAAFFLIAIYLKYETSFENFHSKADRIYRVSYKLDYGNGFQAHWARVADDFVNNLPGEIPEIETLIRFQNHEQKYIKVGNRKFKEEHVYITDGEVFDVFDFELLDGDTREALMHPNSVVITERLARKYFGEEDAYGKHIQILGDWSPEPKSYQITGVMKNLPRQTHLPVDMLLSFQNEAERTWWAYIYVLLRKDTAPATLNPKITKFTTKYSSGEEVTVDFILQPMKSIHLESDLAREIVPNGSLQNVRIFFAVGFLVLIIGVINFTNLNSVMSIARSKEVGVRKILGAEGSFVAISSLAESVLYSLAAMILGGLLVYLIFPYFQHLTDAAFLISPWLMVPSMFGLAVFTGLIAGIYPTLMAVRFHPISLIQHRSYALVFKSSGGFSLKKAMLTFQFFISILLLAAAFIAADQFRYLNRQNLSLEPEEVLAMPRVPDGITDNFYQFKKGLASIPGVKAVSACMEVPSREIRDSGPFVVAGLHDHKQNAPVFDVQIIDHDFLELMNLDLLGGSSIPDYLTYHPIPEFTTEYTHIQYLAEQRRAYLINETAMKKLGWKSPEEAIGREVSWSIGDIELAPGNIVGVVQDYHQETMKNEVESTVYLFEPLWLRTFLLRIETQNMVTTIDQVEAKWNEFFPNYPMDYHFLDDLYNRLYLKERQQLNLLYVFSGLALFVAFLGILGLVAYSLRTRVKEMAIRKVMGANVVDLVRLIGKEYLILLVIGAFFAIPASYYVLSLWLDNFAYHVSISVLNYAFTLLLIGILLLLSVGFQTVKTSSTNPSEVLKDE